MGVWGYPSVQSHSDWLRHGPMIHTGPVMLSVLGARCQGLLWSSGSPLSG